MNFLTRKKVEYINPINPCHKSLVTKLINNYLNGKIDKHMNRYIDKHLNGD